MHFQELFTFMSTFFCIFCVFKYTSFYNFVLIEVKKYNDNVTEKCHFIVFGTHLEDVLASEKEELEPDKKKEDLAPVLEIKYEDKYLAKYLEFSNEYVFTEVEILAEYKTIINDKHIWETNLKKDIAELQKQLTEVLPIIEADSNDKIISNNVIEMMVKYFNIDDYTEDPTSYDVDELFNDLKTIKNELSAQLDVLLTGDIPDFEKLARDLTINNKLDAYINNYILEMTPLGNVYMRYNNNKKSFEYFSNNTIPYRYLEAVGRKYVMTFWCKPLFVNLADELVKAEQKQIDEKKETTIFKPIVKQSFSSKNHIQNVKPNPKPNPNPLTKDLTNVKPNVNPVLLKENANRYTWEGRLSNLMLLKKAEKKSATLSFAEFKLLQQQNKKNDKE
jgi:hypothetical protein